MAESRYYIYRHIRPDKNEPFYVGIGKEGDYRISSKRNRNSYWNDIYNENGGSYEREYMMRDLDIKYACKKEIEFIKLYGRIYNNTGILANILPGGEMGKASIMTVDTRELLAERMTGNSHAKGHKMSEQEKAVRSWRMKNQTPWNKGIIYSDDRRKEMSDVAKGNKSQTGKITITDGIEYKVINKSDNIPEGWYKGAKSKGKRTLEFRQKLSVDRKGRKLNLSEDERMRRKQRAQDSKGSSGNKWINDGIKSLYIKADMDVPIGWNLGRIRTWMNQFGK